MMISTSPHPSSTTTRNGPIARRGGRADHRVGDPPPPLRPAWCRLASSSTASGPRLRATRPPGPRRLRRRLRRESRPAGVAAKKKAERARMSTSPGAMKHDPAQDRSGRTAEPPSAEDRQLRRGRPRKQVGGRDAVLELLRVEPVSFRDAHTAQQGDVRRWTAKTDATDAGPFASNDRERNPVADVRAAALDHVAKLMDSGSTPFLELTGLGTQC